MNKFKSIRIIAILLIMSLALSFPVTATENVNSASEAAGVYIDAEKYLSEASQNVALIKDEEKGEVLQINKNSVFVLNFKIEESGTYELKADYKPLEGNGNEIKLSYDLSGRQGSAFSGEMLLKRLWKDVGEIETNAAGNQYAPRQVECFMWSVENVIPNNTLSIEAMTFELPAGTYTFKVELINEEPLLLNGFYLTEVTDIPTYKELSESRDNLSHYDGEQIIVEGEDAEIKTSSGIVSKSDNTNASLSPSSPSKDIINYIGGTNWSKTSEKLTWYIDVPKDGLYKLGFHYRQSYNTNGISYRSLEIDGETPFVEAKNIPFAYDSYWQFVTLGDDENGEYLFWLEKGQHEISLTATLGPLEKIVEELETVVFDLGEAYRKMIIVMGTTPDSNRDYRLFEQCVGLKENLEACADKLDSLAKQISELTGKKSDSNTIVLLNMSDVTKRLLDNPYRTQLYKDDFYSNYCSIGATLHEMQSMPLDLDAMYFTAPDDEIDSNQVGFFDSLVFSIKRFLNSFFSDYNNLSGENTEKKESITLWLYWGRDQTQVINNLIEELFVPEHDIFVNVKIVNASLIQAMLAGNGPDCSLRLARTSPVDLAMRGALYDLKQFDDYEQVMERFQDGAELPYTLNDGCYALPDTQTFYMMFYRKDILDDYGLSVPKTWDEFFNAAKLLSHNNLLVGVPYTKVNSLDVPSSGIGALSLYPSLLLQNGGNIYNDKLTSTNLSDSLSVDVFSYFTEFYTDRGLPISYDFYNRFRTGEMPLGIAAYTQYNSLAVAAKEIDGLWGMAPIPGTVVDGVINNTSAGGGTGSVILNQSKNKEAAWEFLKWWTSAEVQYRYSSDIESILGAAERQATANVEALSRLSWDEGDKQALLEQWENVTEIPEVPGSYYTVRSLDQAFWSVYNNGQNPRSALNTWAREADDEIKRKLEEYGINLE